VNGGFFRLDDQLRLWDEGWSEAIARDAVWLDGLGTDDQAEQILQRIGGIAISDTSIWRRAQLWGEQFQAVEVARRTSATALPTPGEITRGDLQTARDMGVAMDGAKMHIRDAGWKELKVGCVFEVTLRPEWDQESGETVERAHALHNSYVALLGGPEKFGGLVWAEALRRGVPQARDSVVLGDGAPWIWNLAQEHWGDSWQLVDGYHAKAHLYAAAHLAFGAGSSPAQRWAAGMETILYQGRAWYVAESLRALADDQPTVADDLRREAEYFSSNKRRMQYLEMREEGFPIGSGMVESGCKRFRARFTGAGMRWSRDGAERLLPIRAAVLSQHFDEMWRSAYKSPRR
jgi:hypothetical protein